MLDPDHKNTTYNVYVHRELTRSSINQLANIDQVQLFHQLPDIVTLLPQSQHSIAITSVERRLLCAPEQAVDATTVSLKLSQNLHDSQ